MHKIITLGILTIATLFSFKLPAREMLPEARAAYYHPSDPRFRDIYSGAGLYSIETSVQAWKDLYPWASLGFLYKSGSSKGKNTGTKLYMVPIGIGLKGLFKFDNIQPYLGAGMIIAYTHIHNHSSFVTRSQSKWGVGGIAKTGFLAYVTEALFFDFFLDYTYLKMHLEHSSSKSTLKQRADLSGFSIGGGIGYKF